MNKFEFGKMLKIVYVNAFLLGVCSLFSIFLLYSWFDFKRKIKKKIFYKSLFVRLTDYPFFYEIFHNICIFPLFSNIYKYIPKLSGKVLQVGCGTGYFNKYVNKTYNSDIPELYNLDLNLRHLKYGVKKKRFDQGCEKFRPSHKANRRHQDRSGRDLRRPTGSTKDRQEKGRCRNPMGGWYLYRRCP